MYQRDSEKRLLRAVSTLIENEGFSKVGINKIAREAGCDKVLIYRYFGGLEGLLSAWAEQNDYYTLAYNTFYKEIQHAETDKIRDLTKRVLISQLRFLRENKLMQELIIWELSGNSKFKIIQDIREENGYKLQQAFNERFGFRNEDASLYITILVSSISFMVLCTRQYPVFNGINYNDMRSWKKLETAISNYVDMLFEKLEI